MRPMRLGETSVRVTIESKTERGEVKDSVFWC